MANRVFMIPLRSDLDGAGLSFGDLHPNAGQKSGVLDGVHQNVYAQAMHDQEGATVVNGIAYVSGSLNTTLLGAHNDIDDDTTGLGDDCSATQATCFGLAAYLFDRVEQAAAVNDPPLTIAQANTAAGAIEAAALAGGALTLAAINTILVAAAGAGTELTAAGGTNSFGSVRDVLRILSGEIYRLPLLTILSTVAGGAGFMTLAQRVVLTAAQTAATIATQGQFYDHGDFLVAGDSGYRARPTLVPTTAFNLSNAAGVLFGYKAVTFALLRSNDHAYAAADVLVWRPRATLLGTGNVAATGIGAALGVYDQDGNAL